MDEYGQQGNNQQPPQYQQPILTAPAPDPNKAVMSVKDWLLTLLVFCVPCVGIVMYFVWAFGEGNENRKNYCRAGLIMAAIVIAIYVIFLVIFGAAMFSFMRNTSYY